MKRRTFLATVLGVLAQRDRNGAIPRFINWRIARTMRRTNRQFGILAAAAEQSREATERLTASLRVFEETYGGWDSTEEAVAG